MSKGEKRKKDHVKKTKNQIKKRKKIIKSKKVFENNVIEHLSSRPDQDTKVKGRNFTVSIALPGSILKNAQTPQLRAYLAGQVARACAVFQVDEIVVYDDSSALSTKTTDGDFSGINNHGDPNLQLARFLQYMECPQYLRKDFFPKHPDLKHAGILNPLDSPHHMRKNDWMPFREGVVLTLTDSSSQCSLVNCGLNKLVAIDRKLEPGLRVTVRMSNLKNGEYYKGIVVSPETPRLELGLYWGYNVRLATSLSKAIEECPFDDCERYDLTIGTSERGDSVDHFKIPNFKRLLITFGGLPGLEAGVKSDASLAGVSDPKLLFDHYLNTCPNQGSRTIRTEEAIFITMSSLRPKILNCLS